MSTEVVPYQAAPLDERMEYARTLASAGDLIPRGLFGPPMEGKPPAPSPGKVLLVLETGAMLGLHPVAALSGINVIEGKPAASAALMSAVIRGAGHKLRITEVGTIEGGDYAVTATLIRHDDPDAPFTSTWTPHRAARAGLCAYAQGDGGTWRVTARSSGGKPLPWEAYTESLCKARAVSEVARDGGQDVMSGIRYTPEELGAAVDERGDVIEGVVVDEPAAPSAAAAKQPAAGRQGTRRAPKQATPEPDDQGDAPTPENDAQPQDDAPAIDPQAEALAAAAATGDDIPAIKARVQRNRAARAADAAPEPTDADAPPADDEPHPDDEVIDAELVPDDQDDTPAVLRDDLAADAAADPDAEPFGLVWDEEAEQADPNWARILKASTTTAQVKQVWDQATGRNVLTTDLRQAILTRKAEVEAA